MKNIKGYKPNRLYIVLSVSSVLFIVGILCFTFIYGNQSLTFLKEKVKVVVELVPSFRMEQKDDVFNIIHKIPKIKQSSIHYISKKDALISMQDEFGADLALLKNTNPLFDVITFGLEAKEMNKSSLEIISTTLQKHELVADVYYQDNFAKIIESGLSKMKMFSLFLGVIFLILAITLIYATVSLSIRNKRFIIKQMQLVGATWKFISRPFLQDGVINGLISGVIAISFVQLFLLWLWNSIPESKQFIKFESVLVIYLFMMWLGVCITYLSTYWIVRKFLGLKTEELY